MEWLFGYLLIGLGFYYDRGAIMEATLAAMRDAMEQLGGDAKKINPLVPVDLVIDHSVMVDAYASSTSLQKNIDIEFERNGERYKFLRWGQVGFNNFRVVPPGTGICHQVNVEYLAPVVWTGEQDGNATWTWDGNTLKIASKMFDLDSFDGHLANGGIEADYVWHDLDNDKLNRQVRSTGDAINTYDAATFADKTVVPTQTRTYDLRGNLASVAFKPAGCLSSIHHGR